MKLHDRREFHRGRGSVVPTEFGSCFTRIESVVERERIPSFHGPRDNQSNTWEIIFGSGCRFWAVLNVLGGCACIVERRKAMVLEEDESKTLEAIFLVLER